MTDTTKTGGHKQPSWYVPGLHDYVKPDPARFNKSWTSQDYNDYRTTWFRRYLAWCEAGCPKPHEFGRVFEEIISWCDSKKISEGDA